MRRGVLGYLAVSALLLAAPWSAAHAADMALKARPAAATAAPLPYNWTGFYVGAQGGAGWGHAEDTDATPFDSGRFAVRGGLVGGTLGYNWQLSNVVLGLEGDDAATWIKGSTVGTNPTFGNCGGFPTPHCDSNLRALGTVRGRVGWAIDRYLPYLTGGLAVGSLHGHEGDTPAGGAVGDGTKTVTGWTFGGGIEAMICPNWSIKAEYLHVDLGKHAVFNDLIPAFPTPVVFAQNVRFTTDVFRVGLNYKFDWAMLTPPR